MKKLIFILLILSILGCNSKPNIENKVEKPKETTQTNIETKEIEEKIYSNLTYNTDYTKEWTY